MKRDNDFLDFRHQPNPPDIENRPVQLRLVHIGGVLMDVPPQQVFGAAVPAVIPPADTGIHARADRVILRMLPAAIWDRLHLSVQISRVNKRIFQQVDKQYLLPWLMATAAPSRNRPGAWRR